MSGTARLADVCVDCGSALLLCEHATARITDPMLAFQAKAIEEVSEELAAAVLGRQQAEQRVAELTEAGERLWVELQDAAFGWEMVPEKVQRDASVALEAWRALADAPGSGGEGVE